MLLEVGSGPRSRCFISVVRERVAPREVWPIPVAFCSPLSLSMSAAQGRDGGVKSTEMECTLL